MDGWRGGPTSSVVAARARGLAIAAGLLGATWCDVARADDVEVCAGASEEGQELRDRGRLRAARERFVTCAAERCPAIVRKDCAGWLASVEEKLPSLIVRARDTEGRDLVDVAVTVDGEPIAERLDGRALVVDPGSRTLRFAIAGAPEVTRTLLLREGEKGRVVDVVLGVMGREGGGTGAGGAADAGGAARAGSGFSVPVSGWILGGLSLAGFGALAGFGLSAKSAVDDMRAGCAPACSPERVDVARRDMILANVGLGVGVLALGAAAIVITVHNRAEPAPSAAARAARGEPPWLQEVKVAAGPFGVAVTASF